jgi:hypothetical protein
MKSIKTFETESELQEVIELLKSSNVHCDSYSDGDMFILRVYVGYFIKARDIIIEWQSKQLAV